MLAETVIEFSARTDAELRQAAKLHYWIDLLIELPILVVILFTGTWLTVRAWPISTLLGVKIGLGLVAVSVNLYCAVQVVLRHRCGADMVGFMRYNTRVRAAWIGVPFGVGALVIGLVYFVP